jgi:class 3 adenylate cyclase
MRRTLTVILASDVAGYSRLVGQDEEDTIQRFRQAAAYFTDLVGKYQGNVFNTAGDAILARFDSAVDATRCAIDIQDANNARNAQVDDDRKLLFRIGIAIGDVVVAEDGDLLGDAVNVAARLEGLADPGGICISDDVRAHVLNKVGIRVVDMGPQSLRNIEREIRVFKLLPGAGAAHQAGGRRRRIARSMMWLTASLAGLLFVGVVMLAVLRYGPWGAVAVPDISEGSEQAFDASTVPLVSDQNRASLARYPNEPDFKAIAISRETYAVSVGGPNAAFAQREAMARCNQRDSKGFCRIYAVGTRVVWTKRLLPLPVDMRTQPLDIPLTQAHRDLITWASIPTQLIDNYLKAKDHKAFAIGSGGHWSTANRTSQAEAARVSVERCTDLLQTTCMVLAIDGFLTVDFPKGYRVLQPFTLTGEHDMSDADRQRLSAVYGGKDWRALARSETGKWYAVGDKASETEAVEGALASCRQSESKCALHAIGNFRVGEAIR